MEKEVISFQLLMTELEKDKRLSETEKCVVALQMLTYVGEDSYDDYIKLYPKKCSREESEKFLKENASFIEY